MAHRKTNIDMTEGSIGRKLTAYAMPILAGELFQQFYTMVDSIIVGNFVGRSALAGIGASEIIVRVLIGFFSGLSLGITVLTARFFGAKDRERLNKTVNESLQLAALLGVLMTFCGLLLIRPILLLMDTPAETIPQAELYLQIYFAGILGFVLYSTAAGILQAVGDVRTPLVCLIVSSVMNIFLDLLLVLVFGRGVDGVAAATVASQFAAMAICFLVLLRRRDLFTVNPRRYPLEAESAGQILALGIPTGIQKTITSVSNVLVLSRITFFGEACLAGWVVYNKIDHIITVFVQSLGSALSTFTSQNLGAQKYDRIDRGVRITFAAGTLVFLGIAGILVLVREPMVQVFSGDPETVYYASRFVLYVTWFKLTQLLMNVFSGTLRGAGRMALVTVVMLSGIVAFRQLYLIVITRLCNSPWLVGLSYPVGWTFSGTILMLIYRFRIRKQWREENAGEKEEEHA